jgi:excinuclease ABC subunit A
LNASAFSFNSGQGQCERCRGAGFEKIEMQFLSDVFIRCPDCDGKRYRAHILEIKVGAPESGPINGRSRSGKTKGVRFSIADILDATVEEAIAFFNAFPESKPAQRAVQSLRWLNEVGLGYMKLGQPINTLSGGESQRLKLVRHLAEMEFPATRIGNDNGARVEQPGREASSRAAGRNLFLFDEPTTGLHFEDVRVLLAALQRLVDAGHSVVVIEHNLDVIKSADWVIDLGPGAGDEGGRLVAAGPPEHVASVQGSHTGEALKSVLQGAPKGRGGR